MVEALGGGREAARRDAPGLPRLSRRMALAAGLGGLACGFFGSRAAAAPARGDADSSHAAREDAIRSLPLADLTAETRRKLMAVAERSSIYRRLPQKAIDCDPGLYLFLVRNPEVVVNIWQLMGVSAMTAERVNRFQWKGNDGAGTICDVELVYGTDDTHVLYGDGYYEGPLLKSKIMGRCVILLKTGFSQAADRRWRVANRLDLFLQIDNTAADVVARTLSPWVGKVADANFQESCFFASKLSQQAEQNSAGVQRLSDKLTQVEPPVREEFAKVAAAVQQRAAVRDVGSTVQRR